MDKIPAFIINYNRLTLPKNMADYLATCDGVYPVIIDNGSTYEPLLEYYKTCPHKVEMMGANWGHTVIWYSGLLDKYNIPEFGGEYIISDSDLIIDHIPKDFLQVLRRGLDENSWAVKSGFSLEIKDLPDGEIKRNAIVWEIANWGQKINETFFRAMIDTTFCLMRGRIHDFPAVRTNYPYCAKHAQWYYTTDNIPVDEIYYLKKANGASTYSNILRRVLNITPE